MTAIVVFGAGGRVGRATVLEARRRGHDVTAVVRSPANHADLRSEARLVEGDVTNAADIAKSAQGMDAAVNAAVDLTAQPDAFFAASAGALLEGLSTDGVGRLVYVGLASVLRTSSGTPLMDTDGYPQEYRSFLEGHATGNDVLTSTTTQLDWLVLSPSGDFDHDGVRTGRYRIAPAAASSRISFADFAVAVLDEVERPTHHRTHIGVESA